MLPADTMFGKTADVGVNPRASLVYHTAVGITANETVAIKLYERSWIVITTATYTTTLTLPSVSEAAGMAFFFQLQTDGTTDLTITDAGDDSDFTDVVLPDVNDRAVLISDGVHWFALAAHAGTI